MAINSQPSATIQPTYGRTLDFEFEETTGLGTLTNAVIEVVNITTGESVFFNKPPDSVVGPTGTWTIDPSAIVQTYFCYTAKPSVFGLIDQEYNAANTDAVFEFRLSVRYQYEDAADNNKLKFTATTDVTNDFTILNATRKDSEIASLADYTTAVGGNRLFLTRSPRCMKICLNENHFLSYWNDTNINAIAILENDGALNLSVYDASGPANDIVASFGSGPAQINAIPGGSWLSGGAVIDSDTIDYTVQLGFWNGASFSPVSEAIKFYMTSCCPEVDCRLFWYNRLGGVDAYTFNGRIQEEDDPNSTLFEKPLQIPRQVQDYGKGKFNSRDQTIYTAISQKLTDEEAEWLRELQTSVRVCKIQPTARDPELSPVVVLDVQNIIRNRELPFMVKEIVFTDSNEPIIQQYG